MKKQVRKFKLPTVMSATLCVLLGTASAGFAAQADDSFDVKLKVIAGCRVTVNDIDFGDVDEVLQGTVVISTLNTSCTNGTAYLVTLDPNGNQLDRVEGNMSGSIVGNTDTIPYRVILPFNLTQVGQGLSTSITRNIRGRITANVNATPDTYQDSQTVYLFF
jgi:spore coat protein U-like protein